MRLSLVRYLSPTFFTLFTFSFADAQSKGSITLGGFVDVTDIYHYASNIDLMSTGLTVRGNGYVNRYLEITGGGSFSSGFGEGLEISDQSAWVGIGLASNGIDRQAGTGSNSHLGLSVEVSVSDADFLGSPLILDEVSVNQNLYAGTEISIAPGIFISANSSYGIPEFDYSYYELGMGFKVGEKGMISFNGGISSWYGDQTGSSAYQYIFGTGYTFNF